MGVNSAGRLIDLVTKVVTDYRKASSADTVELKFLRALCLDEAKKNQPDLVKFLASVLGLVAISVTLSQLPQLVTANDAKGSIWTFVRTSH